MAEADLHGLYDFRRHIELPLFNSQIPCSASSRRAFRSHSSPATVFVNGSRRSSPETDATDGQGRSRDRCHHAGQAFCGVRSEVSEAAPSPSFSRCNSHCPQQTVQERDRHAAGNLRPLRHRAPRNRVPGVSAWAACHGSGRPPCLRRMRRRHEIRLVGTYVARRLLQTIPETSALLT